MRGFAGELMLGNDIGTILGNLANTSFNGKTALVSGGAGFLGSWMCDTLLGAGARVICLDNLSSGLETNITHLFHNPDFGFIKHDITIPFEPKEKIDIVIHMASRASPFEFEEFPLEILKSNTIGTLNDLEIARKYGAVFLYTSTSEVYGNPTIVPTPESYYGYVNPIGVRGCYDESKRCGEAYVVAYKKQFGLDIRIARIFNTYGPRMRSDGIYGRALPRFISQALSGEPITVFGKGEQTRSFCYVTDQLRGLLSLILSPKAAGEVINIGDNKEITVLDLAKKVIKLTGSSSPIEFQPLPQDDPTRRRPDLTKAKSILGWQPDISLEDGLQKTIAWISQSLKVVSG